MAFDILKEKGFASHPSEKVRRELITIAGQLGTRDDLDWLYGIFNSAAGEQEKRLVSDAMMDIFQHCDADLLVQWARRFQTNPAQNDFDGQLRRQRAQNLLELAEKKAQAGGDEALLGLIRYRLAETYNNAQLYGLAAKYYGIILENCSDPNERDRIVAAMLAVHLHAGQVESAKQLMANILLTRDLQPEGLILKTLKDYFSSAQKNRTIQQVLTAFASIETADSPRPLWQQYLEEWQSRMPSPPSPPVPGPNSPPSAD